MQYSLSITNPSWQLVFAIPQGSRLQKGRHGLYQEIVAAAKAVPDRFGCYSWGTESHIYYCGSFAKNYKGKNYKTNLHGRIHNYLQNHRIRASTGNKNTNLTVFENVNQVLKHESVLIQLFFFESLEVNGEQVSLEDYKQDASLVLAVEALLICSYRKMGQCEWNRT